LLSADKEHSPQRRVEGSDTSQDLWCRRRCEDVASHGRIEHALAYKTRVRWLVAGASAGYDNDLSLANARLPVQD
jgi:hypothetical protein